MILRHTSVQNPLVNHTYNWTRLFQNRLPLNQDWKLTETLKNVRLPIFCVDKAPSIQNLWTNIINRNPYQKITNLKWHQNSCYDIKVSLIQLWTTLLCCFLCLVKVNTQVYGWVNPDTDFETATKILCSNEHVSWNENSINFNVSFLKSYLTQFLLILNITVNTVHVPSICTMTSKIQKYRLGFPEERHVVETMSLSSFTLRPVMQPRDKIANHAQFTRFNVKYV